MKWNKNDPKSVVVTDYSIFETSRGFGTAGWAPPEQWTGEIIERFQQKNDLY